MVILEEIIKWLPPGIPPIVICQHIPPVFSQNFAQRMNDKYPLNIYDAVNDQVLENGSVYIAPGNWHLRIVCHNNHYVCQLAQSPRVNSHRPSADLLCDSIAALEVPDAIGII